MGRRFNKNRIRNVAKKEVKRIRRWATDEELNALVPDEIDPTNAEKTIYGVMCGGFGSDRHLEMMKKCGFEYTETINFFDSLPVGIGFDYYEEEAFSLIELIIAIKPNLISAVCRYIKREISDNDFKDIINENQ